ncbi:hypothetical protein ACQEWB_00720 [Streptomyces sp. CA-249302]|uniref:hypothetical protein n=1 Tax=Streptomyces sp. CA-249302 TaxID=3240058 RepID=UPI003D94C99C
MSEPTGPVCPECGKSRAADGTPSCSCGRRASDAHRAARTAEAAAAEDFDPVRIRPFVEVGDEAGQLDGSDDPEGVGEQQPPNSAEDLGETAVTVAASDSDHAALSPPLPSPSDAPGPVADAPARCWSPASEPPWPSW